MIKIIADSACDIVDKMTIQNDLYSFTSIPITITLGDEEFIDDGNISTDNYFDKLMQFKGIPRTAAPSPQHFFDAINDDTFDTVFIFCMSSKISATYSSAVLGKSMFEEEFPNSSKTIYIYDTLVATAAETACVLKAIDLIEEKLTPTEINEKISNFIKNDLNFYIILERYNTLVKNGRVSPYIAKIASILSIRPLCKSENGEVVLLHKPRASKVYNKIVDLISNQDIDFTSRTLVITHVRCLERANSIKEKLKEKTNFKNIIIANPTALCITQGDKGGIMIGF